MIGFGSRAHLYARPEAREPLKAFFARIFGCDPETIPGTTMLLCRMDDGTSVSVEFTPDALDDEHALRGAWLEVRTDDPEALRSRVTAAGLPQVKKDGSDRFYFRAPGGQVWGINAMPRS
ncbi:MAG TPA: hypothetical protein VF041_11530 [Gemmatimonadaceae bacterium]